MNNICNYCNKEIDLEKEDKVYCDRCKADYHRDCWIKNRKCVLCDCKTCSEVFSLNKKHNDTDSNTASEFIIEEKPQSKSGKFLEFLKTVGAFLYSLLLCMAVFIPFHLWTDSENDYFFIFSIGFVILLIGYLIYLVVEYNNINLFKVPCGGFLIPFGLIILFLMLQGDISEFIFCVILAYAFIFVLLFFLYKSTSDNTTRKITALVPIFCFVVLSVIDCIRFIPILSFKAIFSCLVVFLIYSIYVIVIIYIGD